MTNRPDKQSGLMIVDDDDGLCRSLSRIVRLHATALVATTVDEAEEHLSVNAVTHLICDYNLGDGVPRGTDLIVEWRKKHPTIRTAILCTGTSATEFVLPAEVDILLPKPVSIDELVSALRTGNS